MSMTTATIRHIRQNAPNTIGLRSYQVSTAPDTMTALSENARMKLEIEIRQLHRSWKEFQDSLRPHEQRPHRLTDSDPADRVRESLREAIELWTTSKQHGLLQKPISRARECLDTMDVHVKLMQELPDPRRAYELFFGVVYSIINASREQYRVVAAFLKFLIRINKAVSSTSLIDRPGELAAALYAQIFLFLGEFMRDYVSKARCRILYSHNEDFKTNFRNLVGSVENLATMKSAAVCPNTYKYLDAAWLAKVGLEGDARLQASQTTVVRQLIWNTQQKKAMNARLAQEWKTKFDAFLAALKAQIDQVYVGADADLCRLSGNCLVEPRNQPSDSGDVTTKRRLLKVMLQQDSSSLQDSFDNSEQIHPFSPGTRLSIPAPVAAELCNWMQINPSRPLAVESSRPLGIPGTLTLISACYVSIARQHNLPAISHFCAASPRATKDSGLIALVYSLIRQLIELAPPMFDCDSSIDLSGERFRRLNGTMASWSDALAILDTLLHNKPPILFCVIDALDVLEDDTTEAPIRSLVDMLASHTTRCSTVSNETQQLIPKDGLLKVFFTTDGQSRAIQSSFSQGQGQTITTDPSHIRAVQADEDTIMTE